MIKRASRVIVVGASGFIGARLFKHLRDRGFDALGTQSRKHRGELLQFDLASQHIVDVLPPEFFGGASAVACICAACTDMEWCARDPQRTRAVNVTGTIRLIDELSKRNCHIVFFSTASVHSGTRRVYDEMVPADPISAYGRQKFEVENYVLSRIPGALVVRISKAIDLAPAARNLLAEWHALARQGQPIQCIRGEAFSPTWIEDISVAIRRLIELNLSGLFNVANPECFTREALARLFLKKLGVEVPVILREAKDLGFRDHRPRCLCLDSTKLQTATGMTFHSVANLIDMYLASHSSGECGGEQ